MAWHYLFGFFDPLATLWLVNHLTNVLDDKLALMIETTNIRTNAHVAQGRTDVAPARRLAQA